MTSAPRRLPAALIYVCAWVPLFLIYAIMLRQNEVAPSAWIALGYSAHYLIPAVVLGALVWRLGRRVPWRRLGWPATIGCELALSLGYTVAWQMTFLTLLGVMAGWEMAQANFRTFLGWPLLLALLVVAMHSAVFHAVRIFVALREREVAAATSEAARARAEMLALRGQLDPHFLFNSLHSITALVREDPSRAEDALLQFSALLRRVLAVKRESTDELTLGEELRFVDDYLAIERLRLGDRLQVTSEIDPAARACRLPAFSVQPLVENAIRHAIAPRRDGGSLVLRATLREGRLEISVRDNGPGADPAALADATGVGLSVIRQRLQLRYGMQATLAVDTAPGQGFGVTLSLPADQEEVAA
jgi:signal transduction histidine kinase